MIMMMTAREISRRLAQQAEDIAKYLLPQGKKVGHEWKVGSIYGESGESLGVHLNGEKAGVWSDFATGISGDLLDLWAATRNLKLIEAIKEASRHLGIAIPKFEGHRPSNYPRPKAHNTLTPLTTSSPVSKYLMQERKLTLKTLNQFKISEHDQEIVFPSFRDNELIFIKYLNLIRKNNKKTIRVEANCEPCLFGWHLIPNNVRTVILCEGEIDAMSLHQYGFPTLSVPFGGGGGNKHRWLEYEYERLAIFDEIYLCFDNDTEGNTATFELIERLGRHRCRIIKLPLKDANECLKANISAEVIKECVTTARTLDPDELKSASHFVDQVIDEFYPQSNVQQGYNAPWEKTIKKVLFRPAELSVWTGINGHGKSQFLGQAILHFMVQGARVCIASLELKPSRLLMRLTRQAAGLAQPIHEDIRNIHNWYSDKLWIFDLVGTTKAKRLLDVFLYARQRYGIDVFIIDSMMKLDIAEDDYKLQKSLIEQLCDFKNTHNCHIHIVVHPRKSADETRRPGKLDNKGTGAISDLADNCFAIWRNKSKEHLKQIQANGASQLSPHERTKLHDPDTLWCCDKQRNGDWEGEFGFWFDPPSLQYLSHAEAQAQRVVTYSNKIIEATAN